MTVYVDSIQSALPYNSKSWKLKSFCHMMADDLTELHDLAGKIGLKRSWFQDHVRDWMAHYDLTPSKRILAIQYGAKEITGKEWVKTHRDGLN